MVTQSLDDLVAYLDALDGPAPLADLVAHLRRLWIDCDDVANHLCFSERQYMRNLMKAGPWYNIVVLCWKNGQRSPIHDHLGSSCGVRVLRGVATETMFDFAPNGQSAPVVARLARRQRLRQPGHRHAPGLEPASGQRRPGDAARLFAAACCRWGRIR